MTEMSKEEIRKFLMQGTFTENSQQLRKMEVHILFRFGLYWKVAIRAMEEMVSFLLPTVRQLKQEIFNVIIG